MVGTFLRFVLKVGLRVVGYNDYSKQRCREGASAMHCLRARLFSRAIFEELSSISGPRRRNSRREEHIPNIDVYL